MTNFSTPAKENNYRYIAQGDRERERESDRYKIFLSLRGPVRSLEGTLNYRHMQCMFIGVNYSIFRRRCDESRQNSTENSRMTGVMSSRSLAIIMSIAESPFSLSSSYISGGFAEKSEKFTIGKDRTMNKSKREKEMSIRSREIRR